MNDKKNEGMNPQDNLKPAQIPVKCVLCQGWGTFSYGKKICNGCGGKGFILVEAKEKEEAK